MQRFDSPPLYGQSRLLESFVRCVAFQSKFMAVNHERDCILYVGHCLGLEMTMGGWNLMWVRAQSFCHQRKNCETLST